MRKRPTSLSVVVLLSVLVLVLGSWGTATAAGLTKGQVKKIAAKVVDKKASGLSVAKAATATTAATATNATNATNAASAANADKLDGLDSTALTTTATVVNLAGPGAVQNTQRQWTFSVAPGTYQLSFNAGIAPSAAGGTALCGFLAPTSFGWSSGERGTGKVAAWLSASSVQTFASATTLTFFCNSTSPTWTIDTNIGLQVSYVKINAATPFALSGRPTEGKVAGD